jgi:hypothetical protein
MWAFRKRRIATVTTVLRHGQNGVTEQQQVLQTTRVLISQTLSKIAKTVEQEFSAKIGRP